MQDRFKFRAIVKGFYYVDTPYENEEFEPTILLENVDVFGENEIGIYTEELISTIAKQYPDLEEKNKQFIVEFFAENSNSWDTEQYITIRPEKILQSTGLKDKNGTLIYEGDIVDILTEIETTATIEWSYDLARFVILFENIQADFDNYWGKDLEVIGNIYENKEFIND